MTSGANVPAVPVTVNGQVAANVPRGKRQIGVNGQIGTLFLGFAHITKINCINYSGANVNSQVGASVGHKQRQAGVGVGVGATAAGATVNGGANVGSGRKRRQVGVNTQVGKQF